MPVLNVKSPGREFTKILLPVATLLVILSGLVITTNLTRKGQEIRKSSAATCNTCYNFNGDSSGIVDAQDVLFVSNRWGESTGSSNYDSIYDVYCSANSQPDGNIDVLDLQTVSNQWGNQSCIPSTTQPTNTPAGPTPTSQPPGTCAPSTPVAECGGKVCALDPPYYVDGQIAFDKRRIPIELQAWWVPNFGHIHWAANIPLWQEVSGTLNFNARMTMHDNPSSLHNVEIQDTSTRIWRSPSSLDGRTCPYDGIHSTTCAFNYDVSLDTAARNDGWRELRLRSVYDTIDPNLAGYDDFINSSGAYMYFNNGKSDNNFNLGQCHMTTQSLNSQTACLVGRGWYKGPEYTVAVIENIPLFVIDARTHPTYTFYARATQEPSSNLTVSLDKTHHIPATGPWPEMRARCGQTLFNKDGNIDTLQPVTVDITQLQTGWHSIAAASTDAEAFTSSCPYCNGELNRVHGIAKVWFYVQN